jgi:hypothetical protein
VVSYEMNLARGRVIPLSTRKRWRGWLAVYFLLVLLVLGGSVGYLTRTRIVLANQEERMAASEQTLRNQWPDNESVADHMRRLSREMDVCEGQVKAIDTFRRGDSRAASNLLGLVNVIPAGMSLGHVTIDSAGAKVGFDVYIPPTRKDEESMTPPHMISLWTKEPLLAGRVSHFVAGKNERVKIGGQDMLSWRFSGSLGGGR